MATTLVKFIAVAILSCVIVWAWIILSWEHSLLIWQYRKPTLRRIDRMADEPKPIATPKRDNLMHLAVAACGNRQSEALTMIKSMVLWLRKKIHIHIFTDDQLHQPIRKWLSAIPVEFRDKVDYTIYGVRFPAPEWRALFRLCASQRLFLSELLRDVDALVYIDTDTLFMRPIDDLWDEFTKFNETHVAAMALESLHQHGGYYRRRNRPNPYYGSTGVNSGVMLMNLTRMREFGWIYHVMTTYTEYKDHLLLGDQDIINAIFHSYSDKLYVLSCDWNYRTDECHNGLCKVAEHSGVSVLHGNRQAFHNSTLTTSTVRAVYDAYHQHQLGVDKPHRIVLSIQQNMERTLDTRGTGYCSKVPQIFTKYIEKEIHYRRN